jgi:Uma2 family endonuclease
MATATETLLTAEEYARLPDNDRPSELVRGRIVEMNPPTPRHGQICSKVDRIVGAYVDAHELGHFLTNDSAVITERNPDTVRGGDLVFYSHAKVPKGPIPPGYLSVVPELVFEVRSEDDRWKKIQRKVAEYLEAGVSVVCVLDDDPPTIYLYTADQPVRILEADDELELPDVLPGFRVTVRRFFE